MRRSSAAPRGGAAPPSALRRALTTTTAANLVSLAAAGTTGILITRSVGAADRGGYAAVMSWFGVALVVGELGQTAATTFFVAGNRADASGYVATSRNLMMFSGLSTMVIGISLSPLLGRGDRELQLGYVVMFGTCILSYVGASFTFSLQAVATTHWNIVRVSQPLLFAAVVWILWLRHSLSLLTCVYAASATILGQTLLAYLLCRRIGLTRGRATPGAAGRMVRFGLLHMAGAIPALLTARLDQLSLSITVDHALLAQYAVAVSISSLVIPAVSAVGSVVFARIASAKQVDYGGTADLRKFALTATALVSSAVAAILMVSARWLVPLLFGVGYRPAAGLVLVLAPGAAMLACGQVAGDVLRGHGLVRAVAHAQWAAAACAVVLLSLLVRPFGAMGAATATTSAAATALAILLMKLRELMPVEPTHGDEASAPAAADENAR